MFMSRIKTKWRSYSAVQLEFVFEIQDTYAIF
jgi:hypothetical protein